MAPEDRAVLEDVGTWVVGQVAGLKAEVDEDSGLVVRERSGGAVEDAVFVVRARAGKLVRIEVHAAKWRPLVDALVKEFEKRGTWSFNGVVRTMEP